MDALPSISSLISSIGRSSHQSIMSRGLNSTRSSFRATKIRKSQKALTPRQSQRPYSSIQAQEEALTKLPGLNPSKCVVTLSTTPKTLTPPEELVFGRAFTGILFL